MLCTTVCQIVESVVTGDVISEDNTVHVNSEAEAKTEHLVFFNYSQISQSHYSVVISVSAFVLCV